VVELAKIGLIEAWDKAVFLTKVLGKCGKKRF